jgi:hypothetical protein
VREKTADFQTAEARPEAIQGAPPRVIACGIRDSYSSSFSGSSSLWRFEEEKEEESE